MMNNINIGKEKSAVRNVYQAIAKEYDERIPGSTANDDRFTETELFFILDGITSKDRVLDIGSGTGRFTIPLAEQAVSVTALDRSPAMLEVAKRKAEDKGLTIQFREGDMTALPFPDNSFDVVTCMLAMMHIPVEERLSVFKEVTRVLAPGGRFLFGVKNKIFEKITSVDRFASIDRTDVVKEELIFTTTRNNQDLTAPWHSFSPKDINRLCALTGLKLVELRGNTPFGAWLSDQILNDERIYDVVRSLENILGGTSPFNYLGYHLLVEAVKPLADVSSNWTVD